jgi:pimeloyl-ACP methyl ester carboxylesterase
MVRRLVALLACAWLLAGAPALRAEDKYFDSGGVKIRYTDDGQGEPVLLIHGFGANVEGQWGVPGVLRALAKNYRVIALDNRGHGKSGKPHDPKMYGTEMVEDAVRLLDHLKIKKAHVIGYSMGAMITAKLLVSHPKRLLSATLGGAGTVGRDKQARIFMDKLAESLENGQGITPLIEALTPAGKPRLTPEQVKLINKFFTTTNDTKALAAVVRGWNGLGVTDAELKANRVPTLALIGADDPLKKAVDALEGRLANLEKIVTIAGADHITAFAQPEFIRALRTFLAKHSSSATKKAPSLSLHP